MKNFPFLRQKKDKEKKKVSGKGLGRAAAAPAAVPKKESSKMVGSVVVCLLLSRT